MTTAVIIQDHAGYKRRVDALRNAHPQVYAVTPSDKPNDHCVSFEPPVDWLPTDPSMTLHKRCWWKADAMGLAAVKQLGIDADFYWFIESDVVASPARWRALFADFANDTTDLVAPMLRSREQRPNASLWNYGPGWATHYILMAVFRLSRAALNECTRCASEMREHFSEVSIPSVVHRAGLSMTGLNVRQTHSNSHTLVAHPHRVILNRNLINHPVKSNTFDVP